MQHCGMPTRFLDWTENSLAALYFAVYETNTPRDATVWIIHLWSLNSCSINLRSVPIISDDIIATYAFRENDRPNIKAELPVAIQPRHTSERIISQKGQFTLHGHDTRGIREMSSSKLRSIDL